MLAVLLLLTAPVRGEMQEDPDPALVALLREAANDVDSFPDHFDAQVWLTDMSARLQQQVTDPEERIEILKRVHFEATRAELPPELVLAVIDVESDFDRFAISSAGALGYMQVMPFWLKNIGRPADNLFNPQVNIRVGCMILRYYLDREKGDMMRALSRYNGNTGSTRYSNRVLRVLSTRWFRQ